MNYGSTVVENGLIEGMTNIVACVVKNKISYNVSAMRSAGLRGIHDQLRKAYERGRTLEFTNTPALRIASVSTSCL